MPQSLTRLYAHLVFSTKNREPFLDEAIRPRVHGYLATVIRGLDSPWVVAGGVADHVHVLCNLSRTTTVAKLVGEAKAASSRWLKHQEPETKDPLLVKFEWQKGYAVFSVSPSLVAKARDYVLSQEDHHRRVGFMDEYRALLGRHGVEHDERYVWG